MSYKKLYKYSKAEDIYKKIFKKMMYKEGFNMMKQVVSCVILPMTKDKNSQI